MRTISRPILLTLALLTTAAAVIGGEAGNWTTLQQPATRPLARSLASMATRNGDALLYGGQSGEVVLTDFWRFNATTNTFVRQNSTTPSPPPRYGHASTTVDI